VKVHNPELTSKKAKERIIIVYKKEGTAKVL